MADGTNNNDLRERPVGELLKQLSDQTTTLVKQEIELAKAEMSEEGQEGRRRRGHVRRCGPVRPGRVRGADHGG